MVARVWGLVDGTEVILEPASLSADNTVWNVPVPRDSDGEYAVEIWAEDEAGLTAHLATMLYIVRGGSIYVRLLPLKYVADLVCERRYFSELLRTEA